MKVERASNGRPFVRLPNGASRFIREADVRSWEAATPGSKLVQDAVANSATALKKAQGTTKRPRKAKTARTKAKPPEEVVKARRTEMREKRAAERAKGRAAEAAADAKREEREAKAARERAARTKKAAADRERRAQQASEKRKDLEETIGITHPWAWGI